MEHAENNLVLVLAPEGQDVMSLTMALQSGKFRMEATSSLAEAELLFRQHHHSVALVDMAKPDDGVQAVEKLRQLDPMLPVVVLAERAQNRDVARAIERGAFDWVARPIDAAKLLDMVSGLMARRGEMLGPVPLEGGLREEPNFRKIIGSSEKIRNVFESIKIVTASDVPVLIQGETGTGKELVARAIHYRGPRRRNAFYPVNCAAIPETLLESELFGHERGAFTGAVERRKGKFELANGGTLFLDEIADMPFATQAKILRVIEDHAFQRVGGSEHIHVDVRIISATNKDVPQEVARGTFREDLYYRLSVFPIQLPPLRERRKDIVELAAYFLQKSAAESNKDMMKLSDGATDALLQHEWPGNVRELQNTIRRAVLLATNGTIEASHLGLKTRGVQAQAGTIQGDIEILLGGLNRGEIIKLERIEEVFIRQALNVTNGNITEAAQRLGVSRSTIYRKLQEYGVVQA